MHIQAFEYCKSALAITLVLSLFSAKQIVCDRDQFLCSSGACTFLTWKCDGDNDCGDNSDEKDCESKRHTRDIFFPVVFGTFAKISFDIQYKNNSNEDYL